VGAIRERIPEAIYELRYRTLSLRVPDEPAERLQSVLGLAEALTAALADLATDKEQVGMLPAS
jgi:hypothetical protein